MELLLIVGGLLILVLVVGNVGSVLARREQEVIMPLDRQQSEEAVAGCFSKILWRPCGGEGDLNWQRRTLGDTGAIVSVVFDSESDRQTLATVWMSRWRSRMGIIASPGSGAPRRVANKLRRMSESLSPSAEAELIGAGAVADGADRGPTDQAEAPTAPVAHEVAADEGGGDEPIADPGLGSGDPRQIAYVFVENCGLSRVLHGRVPAETVIDEALRAAPILADCKNTNAGIMRLNRDPGTLWFAIEGPAGSAVVVSSTKDSDSSVATPEITFPLMRLESNVVHCDIVTLGKGPRSVVDLMREFDVVPVSAHPDLAHTLSDEGFLHGMPISLRRALAGWTRFAAEGYKTFFDHQGRSIEVLVSQLDNPGWPKMLVNIGDVPDADLDRLNTLVGEGPYRFETLIDDQIIFTRELRKHVNAAEVNSLADAMLTDLNRISSQLH